MTTTFKISDDENEEREFLYALDRILDKTDYFINDIDGFLDDDTDDIFKDCIEDFL